MIIKAPDPQWPSLTIFFFKKAVSVTLEVQIKNYNVIKIIVLGISNTITSAF